MNEHFRNAHLLVYTFLIEYSYVSVTLSKSLWIQYKYIVKIHFLANQPHRGIDFRIFIFLKHAIFELTIQRYQYNYIWWSFLFVSIHTTTQCFSYSKWIDFIFFNSEQKWKNPFYFASIKMIESWNYKPLHTNNSQWCKCNFCSNGIFTIALLCLVTIELNFSISNNNSTHFKWIVNIHWKLRCLSVFMCCFVISLIIITAIANVFDIGGFFYHFIW